MGKLKLAKLAIYAAIQVAGLFASWLWSRKSKAHSDGSDSRTKPKENDHALDKVEVELCCVDGNGNDCRGAHRKCRQSNDGGQHARCSRKCDGECQQRSRQPSEQSDGRTNDADPGESATTEDSVRDLEREHGQQSSGDSSDSDGDQPLCDDVDGSILQFVPYGAKLYQPELHDGGIQADSRTGEIAADTPSGEGGGGSLKVFWPSDEEGGGSGGESRQGSV